MHSKKNLFGYLCIVVCGSILSVYLYTLFVSLFGVYEKSFDVTVYIYGVALSKIAAVFAIALILILAMVISALRVKNVIKPLEVNATLSSVAYYTAFCLLLAAGVFFRVKNLIDIKAVLDDSLYLLWKNDCLLTEGSIFKKAFFGLSGFLFTTFGEVYFIPHILNICFYLASVVLVVSFVRAYFGKIEAICVLGALMVFEKFFNLTSDYSGITLTLLAVSAIIFTVTYFLEDLSYKKPVLVNAIICLLTVLLIVLYHFFVNPVFNGILYIPSPRYYDGSAYYGCLFAIAVCALIGAISYFYEKKSKVSLPAVLFLMIFVAGLFSKDTNYKFLYIYPFVATIAGCGFRWFIFGEECEALCDESSEESYEEPYEEIHEELSEETIPKEIIPEEIIPEEVIPEEIIPKGTETGSFESKEPSKKETITLESPIVIVKDIPADNSKVSEPEAIVLPKKVKLLDNPIPIPKRNSRKKIDYAFEPSARQMKFDVEIKDSDDFDIK